MNRRAVVLLELLIAAAILSLAGMVVIGAIRDATQRIGRAERETQASHLLANAFATLDAGLTTPDTLDGPAPGARLPVLDDDSSPFNEDAIGDADWSLVVDTEPASFPGLTRVTITAHHIIDGEVATWTHLVERGGP